MREPATLLSQYLIVVLHDRPLQRALNLGGQAIFLVEASSRGLYRRRAINQSIQGRSGSGRAASRIWAAWVGLLNEGAIQDFTVK
ncbi:hypothetical protein ASD60_02920 [Pseudomonas sp. Root562]|nr:hypothetical protein ASD60_02920 [Pseudomonas sp. Root562]